MERERRDVSMGRGRRGASLMREKEGTGRNCASKRRPSSQAPPFMTTRHTPFIRVKISHIPATASRLLSGVL